MSRYSEAPQEVIDLMDEIIDEHFNELRGNCSIKVLMDNKKRKSKGSYTFASIKKMNPKEKYLSADNMIPEGYDYLMLIDANIYDAVSKEDKIKILFHELCHIFIDIDAKDSCKCVDHDFTGFVKETRTFNDIFETWERLSEIAESIYEEDK